LKTKQASLKVENVEDGRDNFRKIIWEFADGVLGKKVGNGARIISEKALC